MTRGVIAFIDYDERTNNYNLFVSNQFNGDMAPDMVNGEKLIRHFNEIYLNNQNHEESKCHKMKRVVSELANDFSYVREISFERIPLKKSKDGKTYINLQTTYLNKETKEINYKKDIWSSWFKYSDYLYIVPICDVNDDIVVIDEKEDDTSSEHYLKKDYMDVYCFSEHVGTVCPEDGMYTEHELTDEEEDEDENEDIHEEEPFGAVPALNTNILSPKRFVEILAQYKDGDRDCLVVRTVDNKHVIFKQMN